MRTGAAFVSAIVIAAATGAGVVAVADSGEAAEPTTTTASTGSTAAATTTLSISDIAEQAAAGVVEISVTGVSGDGESPFGQRQTEAEGSGFVLDEEGHIVTNAHVVDGAESITVRFANGDEVEATLVGKDDSTDLAVLEVDVPASQLEPLELGSSAAVEVGDAVVAIGSPFGYEGSVTAGIVSALGRTIDAPNGFAISGALQTDAAINHGNSGGPLLDSTGKVIGVNAQIVSESGGNVGLGFAIPSDTVRKVVSQLVAGQTVEHAYLGVSLSTADDGAEVASVRDDSPAADAGLLAGDVITALDGTQIDSVEDVTAALDAKSPGEKVTATVLRDGSSRQVEVTLGTRPS
jgi:putative serine protease PepD